MTPLSDLGRLLREGAEAVETGGNAPFALGSGGAWLVEAGKVEVFAVREGKQGSRLHLATVEPGQMFFGAAPWRGVGLLAVGLQGTRLLRLETAALARRIGAPALTPQLDAWMSRLFDDVPRAVAPKFFQELRQGEEVLLEREGVAVRPHTGVVWLRHLEGASRFLGEEGLVVGGGRIFPLPEAAWLTSAGEARISCVAAEASLDEESLLEGFARFHALFLAHVGLQIERALEQERARLGRKADLDRSTLESAYSRLASILTRLPHREVESDEVADPLLAACRIIGQVQGIAFRSPLESRSGARQGGRLAAICSVSRVRHRRVILRGSWWCQDNGPLVAFRVLDEAQKLTRPVALLPTSPHSYDMVDPVEQTRTPVDAAVMEILNGDAYMFYAPLPERPLDKWDLLRAALRGCERDLSTILLMGVAGGLLGLVIPILTGQIFGNVIPGANRSQLLQMTMALVVSAFATAIFQITRSIAVLRLGGKIDGTVQAAVWDRLLALPVSFFRRFTVGDLASRSMGIDTIRELFTGNVLTSILASFFSLFSFALLFYYSWRLALLATALVVLLMGSTLALVWLQLRRQRDLLRLQGKVSSLLFGLIGGIAKLRVGGAEQRAFSLWAQRFAEQRRHTIRAQHLANIQTTFNATYGVLITLAIFAMVGLSSTADLTVGDFLAFNVAFGQFMTSAFSMIGVFSSVLTMVPLYERLSPILEEVPEVDTSKAEVGELNGEIEFSHVSFRYQEDGPLILDDVSFRAAPGEFIALVGPSGAGKSTCLRMILGFDRPTSGSIYFDGQDLGSLSLQSVRQQLGVVLQSGRPMVGDIFTNIVGSASLGINDAWEAARMAGLEEDIKAMPMGMHTVISEGAETFSGGQKQRLLIARAIVHRPRIILFDEATSALDNRTQEIVSRSLESLKATRIVIAHRLSTIINADRIYVMQNGRVAETGTYEELLRHGGLFAQLAARQIA
jgi:NHLM bacteriocin system ABC transporter ATP-binding protein